MAVRAVVTDIEGTTGSISFVKNTLFPYADARLDEFVRANAQDPIVAKAMTGVDLPTLHRWIAEDRKETALKTLQGMIWESGYKSGELKGHVYEDAVRALRAFRDLDIPVYLYSSGSVQAQQLLFAHSEYGDLTGLIAGYFDTTTGPKTDPASYRKIAIAIDRDPAEVLFISDSPAELDAARRASFEVVQMVRPSDGTAPAQGFSHAPSFDELDTGMS